MTDRDFLATQLLSRAAHLAAVGGRDGRAIGGVFVELAGPEDLQQVPNSEAEASLKSLVSTHNSEQLPNVRPLKHISERKCDAPFGVFLVISRREKF